MLTLRVEHHDPPVACDPDAARGEEQAELILGLALGASDPERFVQGPPVARSPDPRGRVPYHRDSGTIGDAPFPLCAWIPATGRRYRHRQQGGGYLCSHPISVPHMESGSVRRIVTGTEPPRQVCRRLRESLQTRIGASRSVRLLDRELHDVLHVQVVALNAIHVIPNEP